MTNKNQTYQDINRITVSGNLTKNPTVTKIKTPYGETTKSIFCVANNSANGHCNWINVQTIGRMADVAKQLTKGQQATVIGKLTTSKNDKTGFTYTYIKPVRISVPLKSATKPAPKIPASSLPF